MAEKLIKILRADKIDEFRRNIEFNVYDVFNNKEQSVIKSIKKVLERENIKTQYSILGYRVDLYFQDYKLVTEMDEHDHCNRNVDY